MTPGPQAFAPGDLVRLKSGGSPMTVQLATPNLIYCNWFAGRELRTNAFDPELLERTTLRPGEKTPPAIL